MTGLRPGRAARAALALVALVLVAGAGCRSASVPALAASTGVSDAASVSPLAYEKLAGLLWFQTSEEARQLQRTAFRDAEGALAAALADPAWSALGQGEEARSLPPAIITDVDETVLDNSPYEAWRLRRGVAFSSADWRRWVEAAEALPLPGAVEFARAAAARGVTIFYVTNREAAAEEATRANLRAAGFPLRDDSDELDVVLLQGERPDWGSDKESRRRHVAATHRVLLLLGDDLNDFLSGVRDASVERRAELAAGVDDRFGASWFVLPNPLYGSWERALDAGAPKDEPDAAKLRRRLSALRDFRPGP